MNITEITNAKFEKSAFGYKSDEVNAFLQNVAGYVRELEEANQTLERKITVLAQKVEEYRKDESNMKEALLGAQRLGQTVINEANDKASVILAEANIKAEAVIKDAEQESEKKAKELKAQVALEEKRLLKMQKEVSEFKSKLLTIYKSHLDLITALPEVEEEEEPEAAAPAEESAPEAEPEAAAEEVTESEEIAPEAEFESKSFEAKFGELKFGKNFREDE